MAGEERRQGGRPTKEAEAVISQKLMRAAFSVLQRRGMAASVDEIALEAGVSKQALYRRFDGKVDLIRQVVESGLVGLLERQRAELAGIDDPLDALRAWTWLAFENMASPEWLGATALFQRELRHVAEIREDMGRWETMAQAIPLKLVAELGRRGRLCTMKVDEAADILIDLVAAAQTRAERALGRGELSMDWARRCFDSRWGAYVRMLGA